MRTTASLARLTGITYLLLIPFGVFGILYLDSAIIAPGDLPTTVANIREHLFAVRLSVVSSLIVQLLQIALVLLLYRLFRHVSRAAAVLMVAFIMPAVSIAMLNEANTLAAADLASGASYAAAFSTEQIHGLVGILLAKRDFGVMIAQIFWGIWLFPMGYLAFRSGYVPRVIGVLLMIGCFGYLADSFLLLLQVPVGFTVSEYTFLGEVLLPLWLLFRAGHIERLHPPLATS